MTEIGPADEYLKSQKILPPFFYDRPKKNISDPPKNLIKSGVGYATDTPPTNNK